jgi:hypothetical protein
MLPHYLIKLYLSMGWYCKFYLSLFWVSGQTVLSLREMKDRKKRFYNNVNSKKLKSEEELITAIAAMHNFIRAGRGEVIPT